MPIDLTGTAFIAAVVLSIVGYIGTEYRRALYGAPVMLAMVAIVTVLLWLTGLPGFTERMMLSTLSMLALGMGILVIVEEI